MLGCVSIDLSKLAGEKSPDKPTALRGRVQSTSGRSLANVKVTAGDAAAISDAKGHYELKAPAGKTRVRFELAGYVDGYRSMDLVKANPTQLDVSLLSRAEPVPVDAASGGIASGERGVAVRVPPNAFADAAGKTVTGMVDVYLSPLDPSSQNERAAAPELVAEVDGDHELFESLGMVELDVRQDGVKLEIASGKALELSIPVAEGSEPESKIGLWSFDESKSVWVDQGDAAYESDANTYVAMVEHLSLWNVQRAVAATCICGVVKESGKGSLAGARIEASGVSYLGSSTAQTGSDGRFCIAVGKNADVDVTAYHASSGGQSKQVRSKSADTVIPPRSSDARCADVGTWMVAKDVYVSGEVAEGDDIESDAGAGTCAEDSDCETADTVCCDIGSAVKLCLTEKTCDLVKTQM
jgi:hypothetical protein